MPEKPRLSKVLAGAHYAATFDSDSDDEVYDPRKEALVRSLLQELREDPDREGLRRTPLRVAKALDFLTSGYELSAEEIIKKALFEEDVKEMVVVRDIEFYSMCEHHMLPFFGHAHVGYLPNGKVVTRHSPYAHRAPVGPNCRCARAQKQWSWRRVTPA